jgi:lipoprotein NlpI
MKQFLAALSLLYLLAHAWGAEAERLSPRELVRKGMEEFRAGKVTESIKSFEEAARQQPDLRPHLWQLGISFYYAGEYAKGQKLFEAHQKVNEQDVENAVWHFLCAAKLEGVEKARQKFIPITDDRRIPLKEVHQLFAGKGSREEVLAAARKGAESDKDQMFYACLYLALYEEALGKTAESLKLIRQAAGEYAQPHYMGAVAKVHLNLREKKQ